MYLMFYQIVQTIDSPTGLARDSAWEAVQCHSSTCITQLPTAHLLQYVTKIVLHLEITSSLIIYLDLVHNMTSNTFEEKKYVSYGSNKQKL